MGGEVLLQVGGGGECFLTKLALSGLGLAVNSLNVNPQVVASHQQFGTVGTLPAPVLLLLFLMKFQFLIFRLILCI